MSDLLIPEEGEYGAFYETYVSKVKGEDITELLISQVEELRDYFDEMPEEKATQSYEDGKWSFKEVIGHINDTEKIMFFRALCFARNDDQELPGMEQEDYVKAARFNEVPLVNLLEEFELTRYLIRSFMNGLPEEAFSRVGIANGYEISVRALLNIIPGHFKHHMQIIHERYP